MKTSLNIEKGFIDLRKKKISVRTKPRQKSEIQRMIPLIWAFFSIVGLLTAILN